MPCTKHPARFYAADLAAYAAGTLHGEWIDAGPDVDAMRAEIDAMLAKSPVKGAEEWAVHDSDGLPSSFGEHPTLEAIAEFTEWADDTGYEPEELAPVVDYFGTLEDAKEAFGDRLAGIYDDFRAYADEAADELLDVHDVPEDSPLRSYFDYEAYARDLEIEMTAVDLPDGRVAVFYP